MKKILVILVLFFASGLNAKDKIIECNYIAEVDNKYFNNSSELTEDMLLLIKMMFPLNLKVDLKYIDKNNWNVINIETQVDDWVNDFNKIKLPKKINKKEALIIQNVFAFMGLELTINEIMDGTVISFESISNEEVKQLKTTLKTVFEQNYRQEIDDFINPKPDRVFSDPDDIDYLTGRKLNNYVILRWTLDSGILIRNKFEYPNIINESTTNATIKMVGTDGSILLDTTGQCYNSNVSNEENKSKSNQSDSIESKLKKLKSLFDQNLITQDEYDAKRKEILDAM